MSKYTHTYVCVYSYIYVFVVWAFIVWYGRVWAFLSASGWQAKAFVVGGSNRPHPPTQRIQHPHPKGSNIPRGSNIPTQRVHATTPTSQFPIQRAQPPPHPTDSIGHVTVIDSQSCYHFTFGLNSVFHRLVKLGILEDCILEYKRILSNMDNNGVY